MLRGVVMSAISSLLSNNIQNSYDSVSPIENGYVPINARTLNTKNNDFYVNLKSEDNSDKIDNYLETLKEQIEFSKKQTQENKEIRMKELMEENTSFATDLNKKEAIRTYKLIANI
jgi:hypothetical protein